MKTPLLLVTALVSTSCATQTAPGSRPVDSTNGGFDSSAGADASVPSNVTSASSEERSGTSTGTVPSGAPDDKPDASLDGDGETPAPGQSDDGGSSDVSASVSSAVRLSDGGTEAHADTAGAKPFQRPHLVVSGVDKYWSEEELVVASGVTAAIVVDETKTYQKWLGFSGGLNEAGWETLGVLSEADRSMAVKLLFGEEGLHLSLGQIPIGAGESALDRYFPHEVDGDYAMEHFSIERDEVNLIPYVEAARAANPDLGFWAVPWTPPPWMKTNLAADGGKIRNEPEVFHAYALYLAKFIEAYRDRGIDIDALHLQGEVDHEGKYPSCLWDATVLRDFARDYLLPTLDVRELELELWAGDFIDLGSVGWVNVFLEDPVLAPRLAGVGLAWGMLQHLEEVVDTYSGPIFQTQHEHGNAPYRVATFQTLPPNDHAYGVETWALLTDWLEYSSAYNVVNLVLDTYGRNLEPEPPWPQNALLVVDRETKTLRVTPAYYVVRHLSQFLDPGAVRLGETQGHDALVFKNPDGSIVVVQHNRLSTPLNTTLEVRGITYELTVPAEGWATVFVD